MAPKTPGVTVTFDHRSQVIENCEFFTAKDDYVTVVTAKEPSGQFKAIAVHTSGQERDALMASEPCDSVLEAMASLHLKTTEAVQLYIVTNGYSHPPRDLDKDDETALHDEDEDENDDDDDDDATSVASDTTTASSAAASLWSNSDTEVVVTPPSSTARRHGRSSAVPVPAAAARKKPAGATHRKGRKTRGPRPPKAAPAAGRRPPDSDDEWRLPRVRMIHPPHRVLPGARPVPPGWKGGPPPPPPPPAGAFRGARPGSAFAYTMPPPPPPPGFSVPPPPGPPGAFGPLPPMSSMGPHAAPPAMPTGGPPPIMGGGGGGGGTRASAGLPGPAAGAPGPVPTGTGTASSTSPFSSSSSSSSSSPAAAPGPPGPPRTHDVRLTITWLHHSSARVVEAVRPSLRALQETALAYVRQHPQAFEHVTALDAAPGRAWALRACVRRAWFADDGPDAAPWDLAAYRGGDDLSRLFAALEGGGAAARAAPGALPRLEVEVDYIRGPAPAPTAAAGVVPAA